MNWASFLFVQVLTWGAHPWNGVCMWYFYILQSIPKPDCFYKGSTNNLQRRLEQHNSGDVFSSAPYKPYRLVYFEACLNEFAARIRESAVKKSGSISVPLIRRIKESLNLIQ
jgi:putative endonuclease